MKNSIIVVQPLTKCCYCLRPVNLKEDYKKGYHRVCFEEVMNWEPPVVWEHFIRHFYSKGAYSSNTPFPTQRIATYRIRSSSDEVSGPFISTYFDMETEEYNGKVFGRQLTEIHFVNSKRKNYIVLHRYESARRHVYLTKFDVGWSALEAIMILSDVEVHGTIFGKAKTGDNLLKQSPD